MFLPGTYLLYLSISIGVTVWVARALHSRGRVFLVTHLRGNEGLAGSVNDLLVVGFYLVNLGYVLLALRYGIKPSNVVESIEFLATKLGLVLLFLGFFHFGNLLVISRFGRSLAGYFLESEPPIDAELVPSNTAWTTRPGTLH